MYDYTFITELPNGEFRQTTYQKLIIALGIQDEIVQGMPLSEGGTPQAMYIKTIIEKQFKANVRVLFNDQQIL